MAGKRNKIRIGLAQVNPVVGDLAGNARLVCEKIAEAKKLGVQILAFPELILCGYPTEDLLLKPSFISDCEKVLHETAEAARGIAVIVGAPESTTLKSRSADGRPLEQKVLYNTAPVLYRGKVAARYRKIHLPNYGVFDEKRYFTPGERPLVVKFGDIPIGVSVCEDIWMEDGPAATEAFCGGAGILINISASPYHRRKGREREGLMRKRAKKYGAYLCYVNLLGGQDELVFDGSSVICGPDGKVISRAKPFSEDLIIADIPVEVREPAGSDCVDMIDLPSLPPLKKIRRKNRKLPQHPGPTEEVYEALVMGTRDYVDKNDFRGVVLGLSGGIDSALTAAIAVDALGAGRVRGITMPSGYTSDATLKDAKMLASNLGIDLYELPIGNVYDSYLSLLGGIVPSGNVGITEENIQARVRGNLLMAMSNSFGWLVLTTGNKSEVAVGYCTLYGDMAGGFAVLKDVPKTLVYTLSRYRNRIANKAVIPPSTIRRPPSAELRPEQTDQDTLPPYAILDRIIELYVEKDLSLAGIVKEGIDKKVAARVIRMIDLNEYKRRQGPPGIKITPKAFGRDRRLPITNRYRIK